MEEVQDTIRFSETWRPVSHPFIQPTKPRDAGPCWMWAGSTAKAVVEDKP